MRSHDAFTLHVENPSRMRLKGKESEIKIHQNTKNEQKRQKKQNVAFLTIGKRDDIPAFA